MKKGLIQEWDIFRALCPELIMNKIINDDFGANEYKSIRRLLWDFGFCELASEFSSQYYMNHMDKLSICGGIENHYDDYSETDIMYIKLFLDNIKNEDIKNFFECKVSDK